MLIIFLYVKKYGLLRIVQSDEACRNNKLF